MTLPAGVHRAVAAGCLAVLLSACGYSTRSLLPGGVERVAVDVFGNETFYREIEFRLTRELIEELRHRTVYRVARRSSADAVLRGRIIEVERPTLVESDRDLVAEQAVIVRAEVVFERLDTGEELARFVVANRAEFVVRRGETVDTAFAEAVRDLAEDIVNELERRSFLDEMGVVVPPRKPATP